MEGRRVVKRRRQRRNPLYVLFMSLLAATVVLLITVIVLGVKLKSAKADLAEAQEKIEQLRSDSEQGQSGLSDDDAGLLQDGEESGGDQQGDEPQIGDDQQSGTQQTGNATDSNVIDWLDLSGHSEVQVSPRSVYDKYYTYYTTNGVNLRAGPATSYDRVKLLDLGTEVKAAAKQDGWTFVLAGDKFGWINSDYLSTTRPEVQRSTTATTSASTTGTGSTGSSAASAGGTSGTSSSGTSGDTSADSSEMPDWLRTDG